MQLNTCMATFFNGFSGTVSFNSQTYNVESWKATVSAELLDTTNVGDNSFQTNISGVKKLTGDMKLYIDSAALPFGATYLVPGNSAVASLTLGNTSKSIATTLR